MRSLRATFATRLARAVARDAFDALFAAALAHEPPVLTVQPGAAEALT